MVKTGPLLAFLQGRRAGLSRYIGRHPHFTRNMIVDAVASVFTVISIFTFVNYASGSTRVETLRKSGAITMTAEGLISHVKQEKLLVYWLGPIAGDVYTIICTDPGEILVNYIPSGTRLHDSFATSVSVETYKEAVARVSPFGNTAFIDPDDANYVNDESFMTKAIGPIFKEIVIPGTQQRVEIHYPTLSSSLDPRMQPDALIPIS